RAPGGGPGRRRHNLPRLRERHRLPAHAGRLLGLPLFDRDAEARHPEPPAPLRAGGGARRAGRLTEPLPSIRKIRPIRKTRRCAGFLVCGILLPGRLAESYMTMTFAPTWARS